MELIPEALHAENLTSSLTKLLVFPRYNMTANYCQINEFGSTAYNRPIHVNTEPSYLAKSPLINSLLFESALITSKRYTRTLIQLFASTKLVWMYLLFVAVRYHHVSRTLISLSALPPYNDISQVANTFNDTSMNDTTSNNDARKVTQASELAAANTSTSSNEDVSQSENLGNDEEPSGDGADDSKADPASATTDPPNGGPEEFDACPSNRSDPAADIKKPSRIPSPLAPGSEKTPSSQHRKRKTYSVAKAEGGPEPIEEESESELEADDLQDNDEQQYDTQRSNIPSYQHSSNSNNVQQDQFSQMSASVNTQQNTTDTLSSSFSSKDTPLKAHDTISRYADSRHGETSQANSSSSDLTQQESEQPSGNTAEEAARQIYLAKNAALSEARINSLANLDHSQHHTIDLLDIKYYYNLDGSANIYDGPKEIAEKLGLLYTAGENIIIVCSNPPGECEICNQASQEKA
ncbi:hypothetical protein MBANPS3_002005 [Mucor bainieri]